SFYLFIGPYFDICGPFVFRVRCAIFSSSTPSPSIVPDCIQGRDINKCFGAMKICTIEISHSLSNPTDAFRYVVFLCSSRQLESRPLFKHGGGTSSEVLGT
ncbi:hypothetical protein HID58_053859, partial [Brassica napus]